MIFFKSISAWNFDRWADVITIISFGFSIGIFLIGLNLKAEIKRLKYRHLFDKRVDAHIKKLAAIATKINFLLNDYNNNHQTLALELALCQNELEDLKLKIPRKDRHKIQKLIRFINWKKNKPFISLSNVPGNNIINIWKQKFKKLYTTSYSEIWFIQRSIYVVAEQMRNLKLNNKDEL